MREILQAQYHSKLVGADPGSKDNKGSQPVGRDLGLGSW